MYKRLHPASNCVYVQLMGAGSDSEALSGDERGCYSPFKENY